MKVILQENVDNLGYVGDILEVANGYARNFLFPRGMALEASSRNVKALEHAKRITAHKARKVTHSLQELAEKMGKVALTIPMQTGKDDKLFGSVTAKDIEEGLLAQGFEVDRRKIQLPQPIKELGTSSVAIKLHRDIVAQVSVSVVKKGDDGAGSIEPQPPSESRPAESQMQEE